MTRTRLPDASPFGKRVVSWFEVSEDQFQRELNLAGSAGGMIDDPEARTVHDVYWKPEVYQVEGVEELGSELQGRGLGTRPAA